MRELPEFKVELRGRVPGFILLVALVVFLAGSKTSQAQQLQAIPRDSSHRSGWSGQSTDVPPTTQAVTVNETPLFNEYPASDVVDSVPSNWANGVRVGYDRGFVIAAKDATNLEFEDSPFHLKVNGWGQLRQTLFESGGSNPDLHQFQLKRARIIASGSAFTPDFFFYIQLDGRSSSGDQMRLLDYYLTYDLGHHMGNWDRGRFGLKAGKYKMPFSLARWLSGQQLEFSDRSVSSMFFDVNRSLAWGVYGKTTGWSIPVNWEAAIFNGLVTGGAETGSSGTLDNNFAYSARAYCFPAGDWGESEMADFEWHDQIATRVGAACANTVVSRIGSSEFNSFLVVDSGNQLSSLLPVSVDDYSINMYSIDASCKYRGWSATTEYYFRHIDRFQGGSVADLFDHGYWLELGKFVIPGKLQLLTRWSRVVGNSGTLGLSDQSSDEVAGGMVWYMKRQHARFTVDVTHLNGAPVDSTALDISPGDLGWLVRTQLQFSF